MSFDLIGLLMFGLVAVGSPMLFIQTVKQTEVGITLLLGLFFIETLLVSLPPVQLGITLYPQDVLLSMTFVAALVRLMLQRASTRGLKTWLLLGGLITLSLVLGQMAFGKSAGVEFRQFFYFWSAALYCATANYGSSAQRGWQRKWLIVAALVLATVYSRWGLDFLGIKIGDGWDSVGAGVPYRVINASQTLFLAEGFIIALFLWLKGHLEGRWALLLPLFAVSIVMLQHRTVWIITGISLVSVLLLERELNKDHVRLYLLSALAACMALPVLGLSGLLSSIQDVLSSSLSEATNSEHSTFIWRTLSWQVLLQDWLDLNWLEKLIGQPFGSGYLRYLGDEQLLVEASPHNFYVQSLMRVGLIGTLALVVSYVSAGWRLLREGAHVAADALSLRAIGFLVIVQLIYFITYGPYYDQGLLFGIALAMAGGSARSELAEEQALTPILS